MDVHGISVLNCLITFGQPDPNNKAEIVDPKYISEVSNITIEDSYKTLINKASIQFTRWITYRTDRNAKTGKRYKLVGDEDSIFARGMRINIKLCYGPDKNLTTMFDGFITSISPGNPFVIECEDFGYVLKQTALAPIKTDAKGVKLNEFIPEILKGTGIDLHPVSRARDITVGQIIYPQNCTVADILTKFSKGGIVCYIRNYNNKPHLCIGTTFLSSSRNDSVLKDFPDTPYEVYFNENVASDDLKVMKLDMNLLAVEAISIYNDNSRYKMVVRKDPKDPSKFQVVNETKISKKQVKNTILSVSDANSNISNIYGTGNNKIDLKGYNITTIHAYNTDRDGLLKQAEAAFSEICKTGISGTVTLFGDFNMQAGCKVSLHDDLNPERDGVYVVSEVKTSFGSKGYRQEIKIPYKLYDNSNGN